MKNILLACLVFMCGIALGALIRQPAPVHAQSGLVQVTHVHVLSSASAMAQGQLLGISCLRSDAGSADCYIASTQ